MKYNKTNEWLKDFVYFEDINMICFENYIYLKHDLNYTLK